MAKGGDEGADVLPVEEAAVGGAPAGRLSVEEAEALLAALPGVISARLMTGAHGGVREVHVLTGPGVTPGQTTRQVESALYARFGVRIDPRWISVATTTAPLRRRTTAHPWADEPSPPHEQAALDHVVTERSADLRRPAAPPPEHRGSGADGLPDGSGTRPGDARRLYFEDVEARRSLRGGLSCRVVLRRGDAAVGDPGALVEGEAESPGLMRDRPDEVAARAALDALTRGGAGDGFALEGSARVSAFGREFVLVGVLARQGRGATLLTGSAEVRDGGAETAAVLAILDATNRWVARAADVGVQPRAA